MAKVSVQIITWNSMRYIFDCLESLMRQNFRDFSVIIIDNGSDDGTVEFIRNNYPTVSVLQNFKNIGLSKANDQGIKLAKGEYVLIMNPDVILAANFLQDIVNFADQHPEGGVFGSKVLKLKSEAIDQGDQNGLRESIRSNIIDSAGLEIFKSRKVINRGEGQKDNGQYDRTQEVFGISGACVLYRRKALEEIKIRQEYFDYDFFAYKEDIDICWRMHLYGYGCWYHPQAVCYHYRRLSAPDDKNIRSIVKSRKEVSKMLRALSFRNQHLMIVKNDQFINILMAWPWFLFWELKIIFYALIFEPFQYREIVKFFKLLPSMLLKRRTIMAHKVTKPKEIRKWFI
ncbi:MAG: glycosyltransferase family 2 protein [Patescibacteria group bacterium]|nr:glycosyltransferase family 2 protein [Patescibacteria group bacterium]